MRLAASRSRPTSFRCHDSSLTANRRGPLNCALSVSLPCSQWKCASHAVRPGAHETSDWRQPTGHRPRTGAERPRNDPFWTCRRDTPADARSRRAERRHQAGGRRRARQEAWRLHVFEASPPEEETTTRPPFARTLPPFEASLRLHFGSSGARARAISNRRARMGCLRSIGSGAPVRSVSRALLLRKHWATLERMRHVSRSPDAGQVAQNSARPSRCANISHDRTVGARPCSVTPSERSPS